MTSKEIYIDLIKDSIERKLGRSLETPVDFNLLALNISTQCAESLSPSTLMRVWKYIQTNSKPSKATLSILSRFLGYRDFNHFCLEMERSANSSSFIDAETIISRNLRPEDEVVLRWLPDREITVKYLGDNRFEVIKNINSKLLEGYQFTAVSFTKGLPLIASAIKKPDNTFTTYIGARQTGLSSIFLHPRRSCAEAASKESSNQNLVQN